MILLLMLLYSVLASGTFSNFFGTDEESSASNSSTVVPVHSNSTMKLHPRHNAQIKYAKRKRDIPKQANYVTRKIDYCPDVGYFFKREIQANSFQTCHLCFCKDNGTAICWPRENRRCDSESFHLHGLGKKKRELPRSRRSPSSFADLFFTDAAKTAFNQQNPDECKPHENSYSEGCPPADWCVGCTVCDCNVNGRWDCHLLSFCSEDDKKRKKKNRGRTYVQKSIDKTKSDHRYKDNTPSETAQAEAQKLAKLISQIGEKQARRHNGQSPISQKVNEKKRNMTLKAINDMAPKKIPKAVLKHKKDKLTRLQNQDKNTRKSALKTNDNGLVIVRNKDDEIKQKNKEKLKENNEKAKILSKVNAAPKPLHPFNVKSKVQVKRSVQTTKPPLKMMKPTRRGVVKKTPAKVVQKKNNMKQNSNVIKKSKDKMVKRIQSKPKATLKQKPKFKLKPKPTTTTEKITTTTTPTTITSQKPNKKVNKKGRKRQASEAGKIDSKRLISDLQKKFHNRFMTEVDKLIKNEEKTLGVKKTKRSAPFLKKVNLGKKIDLTKKIDDKNHTKSLGVSKSVKRSSKIALDKSNKVKIHRSKRNTPNKNYFDTLKSKWEVELDTVNPIPILPKATHNWTSSSESKDLIKYAVDNTISNLSDESDIKYDGKLKSKRSVDNQSEDFSVISLNLKENNESVLGLQSKNFTIGIKTTTQNTSSQQNSSEVMENEKLVTNKTDTNDSKYLEILDALVPTQEQDLLTTEIRTERDYVTIPMNINVNLTTTDKSSFKHDVTELTATTERDYVTVPINTNVNLTTTDTSQYDFTELTAVTTNVTDINTVSVPNGVNETPVTNQWMNHAIVVDNEPFNKTIQDSIVPDLIAAVNKSDENDVQIISLETEIKPTEMINITSYNQKIEVDVDKHQTQAPTIVVEDNIIVNGYQAEKSKETTENTSEQFSQTPLTVTTDKYIIQDVKSSSILLDTLSSTIVNEEKNLTERPKQLLLEISTQSGDITTTDSYKVLTLENNIITTMMNDIPSTIEDKNLLVIRNENIPKTEYQSSQSYSSTTEAIIHATEKPTDTTTIENHMLLEPVPPNYLKYDLDKNLMTLKEQLMKHKKGKHKKNKKHHKKTKYITSVTNNTPTIKPKHTIDDNVVIILQKDHESETLTNIITESLKPDTTQYKFKNVIDEKSTQDQNTTTEPMVPSGSINNNFENKAKMNTSGSLKRNKINTYDIRKLSMSGKKHKLRKIVTTLYNRTNKDERYYINNHKNDIKSHNKSSDLRAFFKKLLGSFVQKNNKKDSKTNRFRIIRYLHKLLKKIFSTGKDAKNKEPLSQLNKRNVIDTLCATFGPCNINVKNKAKFLSQIDHLNTETYQMLRSIKTIKGLLKLVDFNRNVNMDFQQNKKTKFKTDIQKLHEILRNNYVDDKSFNRITETQKNLIVFIKNSTQDFIQSAAKFATVLNELIGIITVPDHKSKEEHSQEKTDKNEKRNAIRVDKSNETDIEHPLTTLKDLISRYSSIQNTFMKKIYKVISNLDSKESQKHVERSVQPTAITSIPKTKAVKVYTKNIIKNLKKLKDLAQDVNVNARNKRDLRDDDSLEYLLMLMEYLLKQNRPLDAAPVNDGIDLLIDAIRSAPDIKPIEKKVLHQVEISSSNLTTITESSENKNSREESISDENKISKENNYTANLEEIKFNVIDHSVDEEDEDDKYYYRRGFTSSPVKEENPTESSDTTVPPTTAQTYDNPQVKTTEILYTSPEYISPTIADNTVTLVTIKPKPTLSQPEVDDGKFDVFNAEIEDDIIVTSKLDIESTTTPLPESSTGQDKYRLKNIPKNEDESASLSKSNLDWLDETYEEEIKSEINASGIATKPVRKNLIKKSSLQNDVSGFSKEYKLSKGSNEDTVMNKKEMDLLNSLDYGTGKSEVEASESKESNSDDKYADTVNTYFK